MEANFKLQHMCHVNDSGVLDIFFFKFRNMFTWHGEVNLWPNSANEWAGILLLRWYNWVISAQRRAYKKVGLRMMLLNLATWMCLNANIAPGSINLDYWRFCIAHLVSVQNANVTSDMDRKWTTNLLDWYNASIVLCTYVLIGLRCIIVGVQDKTRQRQDKKLGRTKLCCLAIDNIWLFLEPTHFPKRYFSSCYLKCRKTLLLTCIHIYTNTSLTFCDTKHSY